MANTTIQKRAQETAAAKTGGGPTIQQYIKQMSGEIKKALPSVMTPDRFTRIVLSALSVNPKLAATTPKSFLGAMMTAAQLGLEPNTPLGHAYLIPFRNHGVLECQFQIGYKGLIDLAYRSGEVIVTDAFTVYEGDEFSFCYGLNPDLVHKPVLQDRGAPICFYGIFRTKNGGYGFKVMSVEDIRAHARKYSKAYSSGPWQTNFEEMAKKTVLKQVLKYAPLKSDFVRAIAQDETIKTEISADMYEVPAVEVDYEVSSEVIPPNDGTGDVAPSED